MRKKYVTGYRKSSVTCFIVRGRGLYRKSFKKTPEKRKSGISEKKCYMDPRNIKNKEKTSNIGVCNLKILHRPCESITSAMQVSKVL